MTENSHIAVSLAPPGGFKGLGNSTYANPGSNAFNIFAQFLSNVVGIMTIIAFIWFTFRFIASAIKLMYAGGDKQSYEAAREQMRYAIIGVIMVVASIFIINLVGTFIGIPNILDIGGMLSTITGGGGGGGGTNFVR